jgi:hypothetical protein
MDYDSRELVTDSKIDKAEDENTNDIKSIKKALIKESDESFSKKTKIVEILMKAGADKSLKNHLDQSG